MKKLLEFLFKVLPRPKALSPQEKAKYQERHEKSLRSDVDQLKIKVTTLNEQHAELERRKRVLEEKKKAVSESLASLRDILKSKKLELDEVMNNITDLKQKKETLSKSNKEKEVQLNVPLMATLPLRQGEKAFILIEVPQDKESLAYPDVQTRANNFRVPDELPSVDSLLNESHMVPIPWAFSEYREGAVLVVEEYATRTPGVPLCFVGDIHGDYDSLKKIVESIFQEAKSSRIVFLGDLFDRGEKGLECVRLVVWLARKFPGQIVWLQGNHDQALKFNSKKKLFESEVDPAEFSIFLNEHPECLEEGKAICKLIETLPIAAVFDDIWVSHGGVLQRDVVGKFDGFNSLDEDMKNDFIWSRMRDVRAKVPNRRSKGAEVGFQNACDFVDILQQKTGISIHHIVCAHQHEYRKGIGYLPYETYFKDRITCQCICSFADADSNKQPVFLSYNAKHTPCPWRFDS